jgi:hypothetical protein
MVKRGAMINQNRDVITLIDCFSCDLQDQHHLIGARINATEERLGALPGIIFSTPHRCKDKTRIVNYPQSKNAENRENLFRIGSESWLREMAKHAKPDAHLHEGCYLLGKTVQQGK